MDAMREMSDNGERITRRRTTYISWEGGKARVKKIDMSLEFISLFVKVIVAL